MILVHKSTTKHVTWAPLPSWVTVSCGTITTWFIFNSTSVFFRSKFADLCLLINLFLPDFLSMPSCPGLHVLTWEITMLSWILSRRYKMLHVCMINRFVLPATVAVFMLVDLFRCFLFEKTINHDYLYWTFDRNDLYLLYSVSSKNQFNISTWQRRKQ